MSTHTSCRVTPARAAPPYALSIDPSALAEVRADFKRIAREVRLLERHIAWKRVIDKAVIVGRVIRQVETQEAVKDWRD